MYNDISIIIMLNNSGEIIIKRAGKNDKAVKFIFIERWIPVTNNRGESTKQEATNHLNNSLRNKTDTSPAASPAIKVYIFLK